MNLANTKSGAASMASGARTEPGLAGPIERPGRQMGPPSKFAVPRWYAAYTSANHEKRVAEQLRGREMEHFLPLYEAVRRWKDRQVKLELPLFPGYLFVRLALRDRLKVQQVPGVARLVGFDGTPAEVPEEEIESLRITLASGVRAEPHAYLTEGRRVRLKAGPLTGTEGILLRRKGHSRLVVSIGLIQRAVALDVDMADVEAADVTRDGHCSP